MDQSCKQMTQMSWSEEESLVSKEEESSSCSLVHNLLEEKCSMCGDVGLPQYLFKCLTCSQRYQHIYCGKFYPYRIEATICNWCLPMEQVHLVRSTLHKGDDNIMDMKAQNTISIKNAKADYTEAMMHKSTCAVDAPEVRRTLENHTKAFECLLRVAELHDQGHQWDNSACQIDDGHCIISSFFSERNHVGRSQTSGKFHEVDHLAKELNNPEPGSLVIQRLIISGCRESIQERSVHAGRGGDQKIDSFKSGPSISSADLQHDHGHACMDQDRSALLDQQIGMNWTVKKLPNQDLGHVQLLRKLNINQGLGHDQTVKKLNSEAGQAPDHLQKVPAIHEIDNNDQSAKCLDAGAVKRVRVQKQFMETAMSSNPQNINAADEQKAIHHSQSVACRDHNYSDDQVAGKFPLSCRAQGECNIMGPAKRPRHRSQPGAAHLTAGDNDSVFNSAADASDQHGVFSVKQSSPTPHAWSSRAAAPGKRDHLMNSPSRAIKCRYKLLADVLC